MTDPDTTEIDTTDTEKPPSRLERLRRRAGHRTRIAGVLIAIAAAFGVGLWLAPASADDPDEAAPADMAYLLDHEPDDDPGPLEFRKDLRDLRELDPEQRHDAVKGLREKALDGEYGDRVEMRVERRGDRHAAFFALLPDQMQDDLTAAKEADDPKAELDDIRKKALDGDYGDKVKEAFEILQKNRRDGPPQF